jgi:hypothetical protein
MNVNATPQMSDEQRAAIERIAELFGPCVVLTTSVTHINAPAHIAHGLCLNGAARAGAVMLHSPPPEPQPKIALPPADPQLQNRLRRLDGEGMGP